MKDKIAYKLEEVSYSYLGRFEALKRISLEIREGERIVLLGANGSGKSTLLLVLAGLLFPKKGRVRFYGEGLTEEALEASAFQKAFRKRVGIVFQNSDVQLFNSKVEDEILFGLAQLDLPREEIRARMDKYMGLMKIGHLKDRHPQHLSIGEKKRVAIAAVLAMEPEIVLLDEPTSGLDPRTSRQLIDIMFELDKRGCTLVTSTQDIHIVPEIADRVVVMSEDKEIVKDAHAHDVMNDREFLQFHNLIHAHAHTHEGATHIHTHEHPDHHDHPHDHGS